MKIAAIADIHGNSAALKTVLSDIDQQSVDAIINLGDHFSGPLNTRETADLLLSMDMVSIRGNHDRYLIEQSRAEMGPSDLSADLQLEPADREWLAALPSTTRVDEIFMCHGTPDSDTTYWMESVRSDGTVCMAKRRDIETRADGIDSAVIVCGHTHLPRLMRLEDGRLLVNPGSVGCPAYDDIAPVYHIVQSGTPDALYAILERKNSLWSASLRSVSYNSKGMVELALREGREDWANALSSGWLN